MLQEIGPWLVAIAGLITALGTWYAARRENNRKDRLDPVSVVAEAIKTTSDGLTGVVTTLREEVLRLHTDLAKVSADLLVTQNKLVEVQADLAVARSENKRLLGEVARLRGELRNFGAE